MIYEGHFYFTRLATNYCQVHCRALSHAHSQQGCWLLLCDGKVQEKSIRFLSVHLKKKNSAFKRPLLGLVEPSLPLTSPSISQTSPSPRCLSMSWGQWQVNIYFIKKQSSQNNHFLVPHFYFRPSYRRPSHSAASRDPWVKVGFSFSILFDF